MTTMPIMGDGHFESLEAQECHQLLRERAVGRIAFTSVDGPTVLPLSYAVDGNRIVLHTAPGTQLAAVPTGTVVAFEVDDFDGQVLNGWSVLVRGPLAPHEPSAYADEPQPFVPGGRGLVLAIDMDQVTGRAVSR